MSMHDELVDKLAEIPEIEEVKCSDEDTTQNKPYVMILIPYDCVTMEESEDIGVKAKEVTDRSLGVDCVASIEYSVFIDEDQKPETDKSNPLIKLRWRNDSTGSLSSTRLNGHEIKKGLPGERVE